MNDFSILVGVTRLSISLGGAPAILSCQRGQLTLTHARKGTVILAGPLREASFRRARTKMVTVAVGGTSVNIFGYNRYTPKTLRLISERGLPPLVGAALAATWFPNAFEPKKEFLSGFANVTQLLPRLLAENGVAVAER